MATKKKSTSSKTEHDFYIMDDVVYFTMKGRATKEGLYAMVSADKSKFDWYLGKSGYPICYDLG